MPIIEWFWISGGFKINPKKSTSKHESGLYRKKSLICHFWYNLYSFIWMQQSLKAITNFALAPSSDVVKR